MTDNIMVYIILAILILAFLFFVINTIRCYLTKPKYADEEELYETELAHT